MLFADRSLPAPACADVEPPPGELLPDAVLPDSPAREVSPDGVFRVVSAMFPTIRPRTSTRWPT